MPWIIGKESEKISLRQKVFRQRKCRCASCLKALFQAPFSGSLTVETALVLPVFLFAMTAVLYLFWMMQIQYITKNSLNKAAAEISLKSQVSAKQAENLAKAAFYRELKAQKCPLSRIELGIAGFSWKNTKVDEEYMDMLVTYRIKFPISFFGLKSMKFSDGCRMHRWTGNHEQEEDRSYQEWVYVTPAGSVYHLSRTCTHLKLSVTSADRERLKTDLKKYVPCGHCGKKRGGPVIYVTSEGDCYHVKIDCSGLKRTVYMIPKEQVKGKSACSRCGGK